MAASTGSLTTGTVATRSRWRKRLAWVASIVLVFLALGAWPFYTFVAREWELRQAVAEANRLDPGWRWEELEAVRASVPDAENGALQLAAAYRLLPASWPPAPAAEEPEIDEVLDKLPANTSLNDKQVQEVCKALGQAGAALEVARRLAAFPSGRYALAWKPDGVSTLMPHLEQVRDISRLLILDSELWAERRDIDQALNSSQAAFNAGRSLGDEPCTVSQNVHLWCRQRALHALERALARGEGSSGVLEKLQQLLEQEAREPQLLRVARLQRAGLYQFLEALRARSLDRTFDPGMRYAYSLPIKPITYRLPGKAVGWIEAAKAHGCAAAYLRYLTEFVEIAKLPATERVRRLERLQRPDFVQPRFLEGWTIEQEAKIARYCLQAQARLQCALAALAVERYRLTNGRWPETLPELAPAYVAEVPPDPFNARPLGYRRVEDGVIVYVPRPDGWDDGGLWSAGPPAEPGSAISFRLWDMQWRRQLAR